MVVNIPLITSLDTKFYLFSIVSFSFLLSGIKVSIFSLLNLCQVRRSLIHLQAFSFCNDTSSSLLYSLSCSGLNLVDKLYFSKNYFRINLKLFVLNLLQLFRITFIVSMLIISRLMWCLMANLKFADRWNKWKK